MSSKLRDFQQNVRKRRLHRLQLFRGLRQTDRPTDLGIKAPSRSLTNTKLTIAVQNFIIHTDLEKAASGASGACGHFVGNHAILSKRSRSFDFSMSGIPNFTANLKALHLLQLRDIE